jgi:hypothetical protein
MGCLVSIIGVGIGLGMLATGNGFLGLGIIIGSLFFFVKFEEKKKEKRENERLNKSIEEQDSLERRVKDMGFTASQIFQDKMELDRCIVFDEKKKMILFVKGELIRPYQYRDILQSKVLEDGREILDTTRSGATTGAVIGSALGGGIGAVVGGIAGVQDSSSRESVSVKVVINDTIEPSYELELLPRDIKGGEQYVYKQSDKYKNAYKSAQFLHDKISVLIRQAEDINKKHPVLVRNKKEAEEVTPEITPSLADELERLHSLVKSGILTNEEFYQQKQKILNR